MFTLNREDGVSFVIGAYREILRTSGSRLKRELNSLVAECGDFARLRQLTCGAYQLVSSHENGYLLGESVHHYFDEPDHLIYCEVLPNNERILLVVVNHGAVVFDGIVAIKDLAKECNANVDPNVSYLAYLYGALPIADEVQDALHHFKFEKIKHLDLSVFKALPQDESMHLLPTEVVVQAQSTKHSYSAYRIVLIVTALLLGVAFWQYFQSDDTTINSHPGLMEQFEVDFHN